MKVKEFLKQLVKMKSITICWNELIPGQATKTHYYEHKEPYVDNWYIGDCSKGIDKFWLDMEIFFVQVESNGSVFINAEPSKAQIIKNNKIITETDFKEVLDLKYQMKIEDILG